MFTCSRTAKNRPSTRIASRSTSSAPLAAGLQGIVITEHLFRFREAFDLLAGWWEADPNPRLRALTAAYWQDHVNLSMRGYVELIEDARRRGLPVWLGLEMDWIPGRADDLRALLAPFNWDLVLGSVHWLGAFGFDDEARLDEWAVRRVSDVYAEYGALIAELAGSGLADVLAHPDVVKVFGHRLDDPSAFHAGIVAAAQRGGCAIEINTNGLRKPCAELYPAPALLALAREAGVPVTLAADAHSPERLGHNFAAAIAAARTAGYGGYVRFSQRRRTFQPFPELAPP